jgi:hypothetical protein
VRDTTVLEGGMPTLHERERERRKLGGGNRNIIWQFGRFPGSARCPSGKGFVKF